MITSILTLILATAGMAFMAVSLYGLVKYPDFFTRLHVQGVGDTIGAFLIVLAMMVQTGLSLLSLKIMLVFVLIMLTNPLGTNMMMIAAINSHDYQEYIQAKKKVLHRENTGN